MHIFQFENSLYDMHLEVFQAAFVDLHLFHCFFIFFFLFFKNKLWELSLKLNVTLQISSLQQTNGLLAPSNLIIVHG